jgi:hypothetical protein
MCSRSSAWFVGFLLAGCADDDGPFVLSTGVVHADSLEAGAVGSAALATDAVTSTHIRDGEVQSPDIAAESIRAEHLGDRQVGSGALADDAVDGRVLADNAVESRHLKAGAVGTGDIADGAISSKHLAKGSVQAVHLQDGILGSAALADDAVLTQHLGDGAVTRNKVAVGAISTDQLEFNAVTDAELADGAVGSGKIAAGAVTASKIASNAVGSSQLADSVTFGSSSVSGSVTVMSGRSSSSAVSLSSSSVGTGFVETYFRSGNRAGLIGTSSASSNGFIGVNSDDSSCCQAGVYVDSSGRGVVFGDVKSFVVPHPEDPSLRLVYASLEGPEAGAYVRGTGQLVRGMAVIDLPEHFAWVASPEGLTASLTPASPDSLGLAVVELTPTTLVVEELGGGYGSYTFYWRVEAVRVGYETWAVERPASDFSPRVQR